jgi:hypothetical protein
LSGLKPGNEPGEPTKLLVFIIISENYFKISFVCDTSAIAFPGASAFRRQNLAAIFSALLDLETGQFYRLQTLLALWSSPNLLHLTLRIVVAKRFVLFTPSP